MGVMIIQSDLQMLAKCENTCAPCIGMRVGPLDADSVRAAFFFGAAGLHDFGWCA